MKKLIIYGTGYLDLIKLVDAINRQHQTYEILGFINDLPEFKAQHFMGYPVLGGHEVIPDLMKSKDVCFFHNINSSLQNRKEVASRLEQYQCEIVSLIHPVVDLNYVKFGQGCIIPDGCTVGSNVKIGNYLSCRLKSLISHDVTIEDYVYIGPGVTCCGKSVLKEGCFIGAGVTIMTGVSIGKGAVIGAGSIVINDIPDKVIAYGVPAKPMKTIVSDSYKGRGM